MGNNICGSHFVELWFLCECLLVTMNQNVQEIVRRVVENLNAANQPTNINCTSTSSTATQLTLDEEINHAFQIPCGTMRTGRFLLE